MSKGLGHVQRKALAFIEAMPIRVVISLDVTAAVYDIPEGVLITPAQQRSVCRALQKLTKAGRIRNLGRGFHDNRGRYIKCSYPSHERQNGTLDEFEIEYGFQLGWKSVRELAKACRVSRATMHRAVAKIRAENPAACIVIKYERCKSCGSGND